jgi:hypothetical protein
MENVYLDVELSSMTQNRVQWQHAVNTLINLRVPRREAID